jgi:nucleoside-diphosphate-sugar epimerase
MNITNVALIGGTGTLGAPVLKALKASEFNVFVVNRQTSKSVYPRTQVITVPDDLNVDDVAHALLEKKIDALTWSRRRTSSTQHSRLASSE